MDELPVTVDLDDIDLPVIKGLGYGVKGRVLNQEEEQRERTIMMGALKGREFEFWNLFQN